MAFLKCDFYSHALGFGTTMNVILPTDSKNIKDISAFKDRKFPVLYLLHGLSDDYSIWARRSSIDRYVRDQNIAVVMPDAGRSFYTNMKHGYDYYTFISQEVPAIAESFFPVSTDPKNRYIAGLSMGGYGALKIALSNPEKFSKVASLSGAVDILSLGKKLVDEGSLENLNEFYNIFGNLDDFEGSDNDLFHLANECAKSKIKPDIFLTCGTEDFLYDDNINFKNLLETLPFNFTYDEGPGVHHWDYWDLKIQAVLKWLDIKPL